MENTLTSAIENAIDLIGFYIDPDSEHPDVYTLVISNEQDQPLVSEGYVVFFSNPQLASKAAEFCNVDLSPFISLPLEATLECSLAETLYLIGSEDTDPFATIIHFLNVLFDLVRATQFPIPLEYRQVLYALADHLTFERDYAEFLEQNKIPRSAVMNAILWCVGAVVSKSKLLTRSADV